MNQQEFDAQYSALAIEAKRAKNDSLEASQKDRHEVAKIIRGLEAEKTTRYLEADNEFLREVEGYSARHAQYITAKIKLKAKKAEISAYYDDKMHEINEALWERDRERRDTYAERLADINRRKVELSQQYAAWMAERKSNREALREKWMAEHPELYAEKAE